MFVEPPAKHTIAMKTGLRRQTSVGLESGLQWSAEISLLPMVHA